MGQFSMIMIITMIIIVIVAIIGLNVSLAIFLQHDCHHHHQVLCWIFEQTIGFMKVATTS